MNSNAWVKGGRPFSGKRIDSKGNVLHKGYLLVTNLEIQFVLNKKQTEVWSFKSIKNYGCHENVLSIRLGDHDHTEEMIHFKLKEAVVAKELMDQVIKMKRKPTVRMPSFDFTTPFYGMAQSGSGQGGQNIPVQRKNSLQDNLSYYDPSRSYSSAKERSLSATSSDSSVTSPRPLSSEWQSGFDNHTFALDLNTNVQYAQVETFSSTSNSDNKPLTPFPNKTKSAGSKFGYTQVNIEVMEALREIELSEGSGK